MGTEIYLPRPSVRMYLAFSC